MKNALLSFVFIVAIINVNLAQEVEHNYLVRPQSTSCDSLKLHDLSMEQCIELIRVSTFRFDQTFKLTRKQGLQKGEFYSCDTKVGYLIISFDGEEKLYKSIKKRFWSELISSSDPEGFYIKEISHLQNHQ